MQNMPTSSHIVFLCILCLHIFFFFVKYKYRQEDLKLFRIRIKIRSIFMSLFRVVFSVWLKLKKTYTWWNLIFSTKKEGETKTVNQRLYRNIHNGYVWKVWKFDVVIIQENGKVNHSIHSILVNNRYGKKKIML